MAENFKRNSKRMDRLRYPRRFSSLAFMLILTACAPVEMSQEKLVGKWQVDWNCGKERLVLKADGSYVQEIDYVDGGHDLHHGRGWRITPRRTWLDPGRVVLEDGVTFCSVFGKRLAKPEGGERQLATVWEWGRFILEFNPDWQGFSRRE